MTADRTTQETILERIKERLAARIPQFQDGALFYSDDPNPLKIPAGDVLCCLTPGTGNYDQNHFAGGGEDTLTEDFNLLVTLYLRTHLDRTDQLEAAMMGIEKGLISRYKQRLLAALFKDEWTPGGVDATGTAFDLTRNMISPVSCTGPTAYVSAAGATYVRMTLAVSITFDWDLAAEE